MSKPFRRSIDRLFGTLGRDNGISIGVYPVGTVFLLLQMRLNITFAGAGLRWLLSVNVESSVVYP